MPRAMPRMNDSNRDEQSDRGRRRLQVYAGHEFDFQHMLDQQRRYRIETWLDLHAPKRLKKRRIKARAKEKNPCRRVASRQQMIEIVRRRFGEYQGQTDYIRESYASIARGMNYRPSRIFKIIKSYLSKTPNRILEHHEMFVGRKVELTREQADFIGSRDCLKDWVHLPLWRRVQIFNDRFKTNYCQQTLGNYYKMLNIRSLKPQYRFFRPQTAEQQLVAQQNFVQEFLSHVMQGGKFGYYDQSSYHLWMKSQKVWRYPEGYDTSKQFHLVLPKERGSSLTVHALLLGDGRLLYDISERTTTNTIVDFLERKLRNVNGYLIVHDRLQANKSERVQQAFRSRGARTILTPQGACPLSSVETVFGITKERYRKWLLECWGVTTRERSIAKLREIYDGFSRSQGRKVARVSWTVYQHVLDGKIC